MSSSAAKRVLVYGANGALGRHIVDRFKSQEWIITSLDFSPNTESHQSIRLTSGLSSKDAFHLINEQLKEILSGQKLDAIVNVAGGWSGGNITDEKLFDTVDMMMNQSLSTSLISTKLASMYLNEGGLVVLTGAAAALEGTPGMVGYGLAKAAVHHLIASSSKVPESGLPVDSKVVGILPIMLDTPMNRKFMPDADTSTWTPLPTIADKVFGWASSPEDKPVSGTLYKIVTEKGSTLFVPSSST